MLIFFRKRLRTNIWIGDILYILQREKHFVGEASHRHLSSTSWPKASQCRQCSGISGSSGFPGRWLLKMQMPSASFQICSLNLRRWVRSYSVGSIAAMQVDLGSLFLKHWLVEPSSIEEWKWYWNEKRITLVSFIVLWSAAFLPTKLASIDLSFFINKTKGGWYAWVSVD